MRAVADVLSIPGEKFSTGQGNDLRCRPANSHSSHVIEFFNDQFIHAVAVEYSNCSRADSVLANIVRFEKGTHTDSGGGWHLDSLQPAQFKSMIYLTDVGTDNGPFMFVKGSQAANSTLPFFSNLRVPDSYVRDNFAQDQIVEIVGRAGTCVLFDSTYIHRGKQINMGMRVALTTYWYPREEIDHSLEGSP